MIVLLEGSTISTEKLWSTIRVTIGFLVTSLTKALLPRLLKLALFLGLPRLDKMRAPQNRTKPGLLRSDGLHPSWRGALILSMNIDNKALTPLAPQR